VARCKALVAGASGVVGRRLAEYLATRPDWSVIGASRRKPEGDIAFDTVSVDLTNANDCREKFAALSGITHILYAGRYTHTEAPEPIDINTAMLVNLIDAVVPRNSGLKHVHMVQGSKWYGSTLGPYKTPARESDPRVPGNVTFYYAQQDALEARQSAAGWTWSSSRPHAICDRSIGIARSLAMVIAVYAAILKEEGLPLSFPGTRANFSALYQCTDALLLAKAIAWMSTEPRCGNQAFNIINGDYIRWKNLWPVFAEYFGMQPGPVDTMRLADVMPGKKAVWERIVRKHNLAPTPYEQTVLWSYGDFVFEPGYDIMSDTTKARQFGFHEAVDTQQMFIDLFDYYRQHRIIP
jgi:nucleoside-diphosphate-sugar epimerase